MHRLRCITKCAYIHAGVGTQEKMWLLVYVILLISGIVSSQRYQGGYKPCPTGWSNFGGMCFHYNSRKGAWDMLSTSRNKNNYGNTRYGNTRYWGSSSSSSSSDSSSRSDERYGY